MKRRHPWLASILAVAVTVGGVVCACATGPLDVGAAAAHDPHHTEGHAPADRACERVDCTGSCGFDGAVSERDPLPAKPPNASDDFAQLPAPFPDAVAPQPAALRHAAVPIRPGRSPDTPVHRFDKLLN